jgi:ribosomal protein S20
MPNIQQQKKRVLIASRQRDENLRYRSTIKTLGKRLDAAVAAGDADAIATEHLTLVRKKSQAARLVSGASS